KHENFRFTYYCSRDGDALLLTTRQRDTSFTNTCGKALREIHDVVVDVGIFRGLQYFLFFRRSHSECDVIEDRITEEKYVLRNITNLTPQRRDVIVRNRDVVNQNGTVTRIVKSRHEIGNRAFS